MGHGKETPRQKMIGMMYLVLTALLALNVSAEVLNAFQLIDKSLRTSTQNTNAVIESKQGEFVKAMANDSLGTLRWYQEAMKVSKEADYVYNEIQRYKELLVTTLEGKTVEQLKALAKEKHGEGDHPIEELLTKKDDNNVPGQIFILEGKGDSVKVRLDNYAAFLKKVVSLDTLSTESAVASKNNMIKNINLTLFTGRMKSETGEDSVPWASAHFEHLPAAGVVALMSKMQGDVRNLQAQMISYLLTQIGKTDMKFNAIKAVVNAPTSYVLVNQPYKAEVFIAAYDSTQNPDIIVNGSPIQVTRGVGTFTGNTGSVGLKTWAGVIKLKNKSTGEVKEYPFKSEYQVGEPNVSVSPTKMNVFYIGVDNPVDITASGIPDDKLKVSISPHGTITRNGKSWTVNVKQQAEVKINIMADMGDGQVRNMGSKPFRVKRVPDPVAVVGSDPANKKGGIMSKSLLLAQPGVKAELENFDFQLTYDITGFTVSATIRGFTEDAKSTNAAFTPQQKQLIRNVDVGKKVYIEEITARGPGGDTRKLGALSFKLN